MASAASSASEIPDVTNLGSGPVQLVRVGVAFLVVAWISTALRFWTRTMIIRSLGWDDYTMLLTMISFTVQCAYLIRGGIIEMHPEQIVTLGAIAELITDVIAFSASFVMTTIILKISLALFFLRIIITDWQRKVMYYITAIYTAYALVYFICVTFGCGLPADYLFNTAKGKCLSVDRVVIPMSYAQTCANAAVDWVYVLLPMHTLWNLRMPRTTKQWASLLILLGALGSVASLVRLGSVDGLSPGRDFLRRSVNTRIWATIEPGLGIVAVSLATTRPMFRRFLETTRVGYSGNGSGFNHVDAAATGNGGGSKSLALGPVSAPIVDPGEKQQTVHTYQGTWV
ncbi:hypothetical protein AAFC00_003747 [Neodothiora populina]|uniref:Rhodopsin domain-containing protein n=1 Tax=Neodothiora populina TaxID=2781224 RepID=A0ABR3PFP9_9PEZI